MPHRKGMNLLRKSGSRSKKKYNNRGRKGNPRLSNDTESFFRGIENKYPERLRNATINTEYIPNTQVLSVPRCFRSPRSSDEKKCCAQVNIVNGDTIDVAYRLQREGLNPLVLNMASAWCPGGGWRKGSKAQEESLFYRSTYAVSLENCMNLDPERKWSYPIPLTGAIYSPDVFVFRSSMKQGHKLYRWEDCSWMSFVAVAAIRQPVLTSDNGMSHHDIIITSKKIEGIFKVALKHNHDSLVLGAFGCGAYRNPPHVIAQIFRDIIGVYKKYFKKITFAIFDDHNTRKNHNPRGNIIEFREVFADMINN